MLESLSFFKKIKISPEFYPKTYTILKKGYGFKTLLKDFQAAVTVSVVSLPLAMALAIASGCTPDRGLYTSVIAGFLISFLGGSRHQIAGPTAAFVVVIYNVIAQFGYDGLVIATLMAGIMLLIAGALRFGTIIKYLPFPITTGFTTGIGFFLFVSQFKELLGLKIDKVPGHFLAKIQCFASNITSLSIQTILLSIFTLSIIFALKKWKPKLPGFSIAFFLSTLVTLLLKLDVDTIEKVFGAIPSSLPKMQIPSFSLKLLMDLFPSAFTIAFLAGIESLLSCVIADSIAGTNHRSNCELVAQGIGNIASALFGGIPATGALARTATNVRSGGVTPISGMLHAIFIFLMMLFLSPYIKLIPLASLASILVVVSLNMIDLENVKYMIRAAKTDSAVFIVTFTLTLFLDITIAIEVGAILAMLFFTTRMIATTEEQIAKKEHLHTDLTPYEHGLQTLPNDIEMIYIAGPFFFGVASRVNDVLNQLEESPLVIILDMQNVPFIDASGVFVLKNFIECAGEKGVKIILTAVNKKIKNTLLKMSGEKSSIWGEIVDDHDKAIERAYEIRNEKLTTTT